MKKIFSLFLFLILFLLTGIVLRSQSFAFTGDLTSVARYASGPCATHNPCQFDTVSDPIINGQQVESITAYGRYWNYDLNGNPWPNASQFTGDLTSVSRYAQGPCATHNPCQFDTVSDPIINGQQVESITAYGRYWNYDLNGNPWPNASQFSGDLTSVARYASGPCATHNPCQFDTVSDPAVAAGGNEVESITAYGKYWNYDLNGNPWPNANQFSGTLTSVARYASGPCVNHNPCQFDTVSDPTINGIGVESITAYGHYWNYDFNGNPWPPFGASLTLVLGLPGIGYNGPTGVSPKHLTRPVTIQLYNTGVTDPSGPGTTPLTTATGTVTFDSGSDSNAGYFVGTVNITLPSNPPANNQYQILVQVPQYLYQLAVVNPPPSDSSLAHIFTLTTGNSASTAPFSLIPGDVAITNGGLNHLTLDDYTIIAACYGNNATGSNCPVKSSGPYGMNLADLNDDGQVDIVDLNLWLRSLSQLQQAQAPGCATADCQGD